MLHRSTSLSASSPSPEREDASDAMDNMNGAELYGRVLTVNYAMPELIKCGEQGWAPQPIELGADTWFERQQQEQERQRLQAEQRAAMQPAEMHREKMAEKAMLRTIRWQRLKQEF
ncbi:UNVERIFIED_CONTAM: hypothetical protein Sradi_6736100 [Sesamum radiatum]|uniref:Uncharacterized protein n=1 Tax=Sesamum radiatum TaxID=300843 RepID=A0AAW2JQE3_SESRA